MRRRVKERVELSTSLNRQDFFSTAIKDNAWLGPAWREARTLLVAGSETTASGLVTYYLLMSPTSTYLLKLYMEIRSPSGSYAEITGDSTATIPYLQ